MYQVKLIIALAICWLAAATVHAQKDSLPAPAGEEQFRIRTSITSFLEPDAHVLLGMEWRWNQSYSLGMDVGYIYYNALDDDNDSRNTTGSRGFKLRPEVRYYFNPGRKKDWFVAGEFSYKQVAYDRSGELCLVRNGGFGCNIFHRIDYTETKRVPGFSIKFGFQQYIGRQQRLYYEWFLGVGFKNISRSYKYYELPAGVSDAQLEDLTSSFFFDLPFSGVGPHIPFGFKFGFRL